MPRTTKHLKKHNFKPGQSGNPQGARLHDPVTKALSRLTIDTYREVIEVVLTGNLTALKEMAEHPDTPAIQVGVATAFLKAIKTGDYAVIERIAERIVGKIPDVLNVNSNNNTNLNATVTAIDKTALRKAMAESENDV